MKFKARKKKSFILDDGTYEAQIIGAAETAASNDDATPQIEVDFQVQTEEGPRKIKHWYNLVGYQKDDDGEFIVEDDKRLKDKANTEAALAILEGLAYDGGMDQDQSFTLEDLVGLSVGIVVETNPMGNKRITRSCPVEEL